MDIRKHKLIGMDTMCFIYYFERDPVFRDVVGKLFALIEEGKIKGCTTVVTLSEILVKPMVEENIYLADEYKNTLNSFPHLEILEINQYIAVTAATMKAKYKIKLPDALQIAGAYIGGADLFVTNDKQMKKIEELKVVTLNQL